MRRRKKGSNCGIQNVTVVSQLLPRRISPAGRLHAHEKAAAYPHQDFLDSARGIHSHLFIGASERHKQRDFGILRRSEEHTSELQSHVNLVCRLLLEKKKT